MAFTRYSLNSLKHQFNFSLQTWFWKFLDQNINFRYVERTNGEHYSLMDFRLNLNYKKWDFFAVANNIFDTAYTEANLIPMPGINFSFGLKYTFRYL